MTKPKKKGKADGAKADRLRSALIESSGKKPVAPAAQPQTVPVGRGRKGKKGIAIYMTPMAKEVLEKIARKHKLSVQQLGIEAINLLFRKYDEMPVA